MSILDKQRSIGLSLGRGVRRIKRSMHAGLTSMSGLSSLVPDRLAIAPQDLRTADPTISQEFYNGHYTLGGATAETHGMSPFSIDPPTRAWSEELHGFTWLRHLAAGNDSLSAGLARALVRDWVELHSETPHDIVWDIQTVSQRTISWLCHSITILNGADHEFHRLFMRNLGTHIRFLRRNAVSAVDGMPRLTAHIALAYASVCYSGQSSPLQLAGSKLSQLLEEQILPDGGHVSRNPQDTVEILALLLPLKQGYVAVDAEPPAGLISAIERLMPALRFFRHGDGTIARFNGAGVTEKDLVVTLLRYDENFGQPLLDAVQSGYQRMQIGDGLVIMDTGEPSKDELSLKAHAGTMSFEFSFGSECLIVNCGTPASHHLQQSAVWRTSAAHSTAVMNDTSSSKFESPGSGERPIAGQIVSIQLKTSAARDDGSDHSTITAHHHGYVREFGARHQRTLTLDQSGKRLIGNEWFSSADKGDLRYTTKDAVALRFHLHPDIKASIAANSEACLIETRNGEQWRFDCPGFKVELMESVFFAALPSPRPSWQIVIQTKAYETPEISWSLQKIEAS